MPRPASKSIARRGNATELALPLVIALALTACGGGGGSGPPAATPTWPSSGAYAVALRPSGSYFAAPLTVALSLVHAATPRVEYVVDSNAFTNALGVQLDRGNYDATTRQVSGVTPVAYVDAPAGALRTTLLTANGARPRTLDGPAAALCSKSTLANDFSSPFASELVVATPGADGVCGTADDAQLLVSFNADGSAVKQPVSGYIGYMRSATTGRPTHWLATNPNGAATLLPMGTGGSAFVVAIGTPGTTGNAFAGVASQGETIVYTQNGALNAVRGPGTAPTGVALSALTGPEGWKSAGHDADVLTMYLDSFASSSGAGTWRVLSLDRTTLAVRTLATGSGSILQASTLPGSVYATLVGPGGGTASVIRIATNTGAQSTYLPASTSFSTVTADASGVNFMLTATPSTVVSTTLIDNQGATLSTLSPGLVYGLDGDRFDTLENVYVASGIYLTAFSSPTFLGGASLTRYDTSARTTQLVGTIPLGGALGGVNNEAVYAVPPAGRAGIIGIYIARLAGSQIQATGSGLYTLVPGPGNSLLPTTSRVP
ncbi:MAG: hypothetical protein ABI699_12855 [Caldimonas sp.]